MFILIDAQSKEHNLVAVGTQGLCSLVEDLVLYFLVVLRGQGTLPWGILYNWEGHGWGYEVIKVVVEGTDWLAS